MKNPIENHTVKFLLAIIAVFAMFFWSLDLMTSSFKLISKETVVEILSFTSNPFISLFVGIFITAVIQSSSTTTSLIVAIVASGSLSLENAIPMVMGANIGTSLTNTLIAISYINNNREFKNALSCASTHDFFNIMTVAVLFPLEYYYNILSSLSSDVASLFNVSSSVNSNSGISNFNVIGIFNQYLMEVVNYKWILVAVSLLTLFISIKIMSKIISTQLIGKTKERFQEVFFRNTLNSFGLGVLLTSAIQSSSISTSIIVPFAATGKISTHKLFPYIIGANIGTTLTALIAALNKSEAALSIAFAHFLFNTSGTLIFLFIPYIKEIPVFLSERFAQITVNYKIIGFAYLLFVFFIFPLTLIFINKFFIR